MAENPQPSKKKNGRSFTLQLFLITILPLSLLLLIVAFGSQSLHHEAMRSLVGDRDLRTVRATSSSLERELAHISSTLQILSKSLNDQANLSDLILTPSELSSLFDGGIALYSDDGALLQSTTPASNWQHLPSFFPDLFSQDLKANPNGVVSELLTSRSDSLSMMYLGIHTSNHRILVGAFLPARLIQDAIGELSSSDQTTLLVVSPAKPAGNYHILFRAGPVKVDEISPAHPGIREVLKGESGINYFQSPEGEHVIAFYPISSTGWGLIIEEAWEDIASPYLVSTQSAPLVVVPLFLVSLLAILFGARSIVTPLQNLERLAGTLKAGDFEAIHQSVGGIEEIHNLQFELIDMAEKLKAAQQSLRSYIGAITSGVENERRSLARELHDETIQSLIALNQRIQLAGMNATETQKNSLTELQDLVQQSIQNLRRMIRGLRPIYLEDLGLVASLEMLVQEIQQASSLSISFATDGEEQRLSSQRELSIYRMVQESLSNVVRHANAKHVWVELKFSEGDCTVLIRDDGQGFLAPANPAELSRQGHFGLLGLQERAELMNARLSIDSKPGKGTTIQIHLENVAVPETA